ncbi:hypothetical protein [Saccharopolyspora pogona]|uniref:hypothetical protein n=1 Tax=Saccharopolyspora pogona TaxID=333966 RepID=UPI0016878AB1|nr:hypothetical protein [Saccharopolyspora pogona]
MRSLPLPITVVLTALNQAGSVASKLFPPLADRWRVFAVDFAQWRQDQVLAA